MCTVLTSSRFGLATLVAMPFWERGSVVQALTHCGARKASACTLFQHL